MDVYGGPVTVVPTVGSIQEDVWVNMFNSSGIAQSSDKLWCQSLLIPLIGHWNTESNIII